MKNEIKAPNLPALPPQMATNLPSVYVTPVDMDAGFLDRFAAKWRARDVEKIVTAQRGASDQMLQIGKNNAEAMKIHMTFAAEVQMVFVRFEHEKSIMALVEKKAEKEIELLDFSGQKIQLENQILFYQSKEAEISVKTAELDFEARKKAMEEDYAR